MLDRLARIGLALFLLAVASPGWAEGPSDKNVGVHVGDSWTYDVVDEITGSKTERLTFAATEVGHEISVRVARSVNGVDTGKTMFVFDGQWDTVSDARYRYIPNDGRGPPTDLKAGAERRQQFQVQDMKVGGAAKGHSVGKCTGEEEIKTDAGSFKTYKVVTETKIAPANDPARSTQITLTTWYAPEVKRWVKRTFLIKVAGHVKDNFTHQLVAYSLK